MPIGRDKPESTNADPVLEAQLNLVGNAAIDPQDLLAEDADPLLSQPAVPDVDEVPTEPEVDEDVSRS